ncbi:alkyl hydroperoxide reductase [Microbacterium sp. AISO3]|jgi:thiol-disulfide isomerase/thioredoxin|uniref:Thiol-disulfide isomerase/thioredoxin n=2 Tax=Microbacterium TaxID=33882 RepID=A0ABU1I5E9_9MICO|nr:MULTISPECIES: TlpA disulfide reductase family protein [Microbacterium]MDR6168732.1 thiol-disulfide isomerase/thioredoxin [Microbacterium paludicola]OAZ41002.1 alkyl hydroperoxide reductase [Microbacterium arborescens]OWP21931.1 alkyl hydroperoxide reductase [Microbacterium sp. AISO3]POX67701.1 TlpA family protein disulfide reductase [Microbacterium sp. Ru50]QCR39634.1 TlpA family protein disulfide reductase [Microbacterium sp. SGAir0570]
MKRRLVAAVLALGLAAGLAACSSPNDDLAGQYRDGDNKGFISGDGTTTEIPEAERGAPIEFTGTAVDGSTISSADYAGKPLVLNFWYAQCGPCRAEAPLLEEVYTDTQEVGAEFLGVNIYDGPEQASAFEQNYGISYPSLLMQGDGELKLALAASASVQAAPTTLVLDTEGRVAARIVGQLRDAGILRTLVEDAAKAGAGAGSS